MIGLDFFRTCRHCNYPEEMVGCVEYADDLGMAVCAECCERLRSRRSERNLIEGESYKEADVEIELRDAIACLIDHLKKDEEYRDVWRSNIARACYNEIYEERRQWTGYYLTRTDVWNGCNKGADRFLNLLYKAID